MPQVKITTISNLWVRQMNFTHKGDTEKGHKHVFDHPTLLAYGKFKVYVEGEFAIYDADELGGIVLYIEKGKEHAIECISEKGLGFCLHPIRDGERVEDIVDPSQMPLKNLHMADFNKITEG